MKAITVYIIGKTYKVYVVISSKKQVIKWVNDYMGKGSASDDNSFQGCTYFKRGFHPVIWVDEKNKHPLAVTAHESVHAVKYIYEYIQEGQFTDELFAHMVGMVVEEVEKYYHRKRV